MARIPKGLQTWAAGVVALLAIAGLAYWATRPSVPSPMYKGKRLSYWFDQLPTTEVISAGYGAGPTALVLFNSTGKSPSAQKLIIPPSEKSEDAIRAIEAMGTNALPLLMARLSTQDSRFKQEVRKWLGKLGVRRRFMESSTVGQGRATTALMFLRPLPDDVMSQLRVLGTNTDMATAALSSFVIDCGGRSDEIRGITNLLTIIGLSNQQTAPVNKR